MLVTGAGGSIGSELCRQIARFGPARLVLVEHAEAALFEIERELVDERGFSAVAARARRRAATARKMRQVFERYEPTVVFHAAAYKHVPLMEANPLEAVRNNALATRVAGRGRGRVRRRAVRAGLDRQGGEPEDVMGASKALCEGSSRRAGTATDVATRFVAVRFGNVLGSSGSVIPIFRRQIARGGPVTVTHPEMTRYFMTIPEAVQLVLQAGAIGGRGEIFVLDMGEPVTIVDLAQQHDPALGQGARDANRDRRSPASRPGEKLHEELWNEGEKVVPTEHPKILRARPAADRRAVARGRAGRAGAARRGGRDARARRRLAAMMREPRRLAPESVEAAASQAEAWAAEPRG